MIAYNNKKYNVENYNNKKEFINVHETKCSCGCSGSCIKYGNYKRKYIKNGNKKIIYIQRIYCKECKRTQAILPYDIIPYKLITLNDVLDIIEAYEENEEIVDPPEKEIMKTYKKWKERLNIIKFIRDEIEKIISFCAFRFKMCFMQNKRKLYQNKGKIYEVIYLTISLPT